MDGVILAPLKQIYNPKGDIFHAMKQSDYGFCGFGEAYFSTINEKEIKGWKKHNQMVLNIVVCLGEIKFVIYDDIKHEFFSVNLSHENYQRLTIKNGLWMAFCGLGKNNMLLNIASIEHDPNESISMDINNIKYDF